MNSICPNGLGRWIDCVLVFDDENLMAVDQVVRMMIHACHHIHFFMFIFWLREKEGEEEREREGGDGPIPRWMYQVGPVTV